MECIYEFECEQCQHHFDEFAERKLAEDQKTRATVTTKCPLCGGDSYILPVQLVGHGQNHTSWSVK